MLVRYCPDCGRSFRHFFKDVINLKSLAPVGALLSVWDRQHFACCHFQVSDYSGVLSSKPHANPADYININNLR